MGLNLGSMFGLGRYYSRIIGGSLMLFGFLLATPQMRETGCRQSPTKNEAITSSENWLYFARRFPRHNSGRIPCLDNRNLDENGTAVDIHSDSMDDIHNRGIHIPLQHDEIDERVLPQADRNTVEDSDEPDVSCTECYNDDSDLLYGNVV